MLPSSDVRNTIKLVSFFLLRLKQLLYRLDILFTGTHDLLVCIFFCIAIMTKKVSSVFLIASYYLSFPSLFLFISFKISFVDNCFIMIHVFFLFYSNIRTQSITTFVYIFVLQKISYIKKNEHTTDKK